MMTSRSWLKLVCVALTATATGCISIGSVQTASTVGRGKYEIGIEPGVQVLAGSAAGSALGSAILPYPHLDGSFRYGITDNIDIGARTGFSLLELQTKFMFTDRNNDRLALSLAPTVAAVFFGVTYMNIQVPFLVGIKVGEDNEFIIGPRMQNILLFGGGTVDGTSGSGLLYLMSVGGTLGFAFRVSDSVKLLPELALQVPVVGAVSTSAGSASGGIGAAGLSAIQIQFKFGILIGNSQKRRTSGDVGDLPPPPPPPPPGAEGEMPPPPPPPPPAP